MRNTLFLSVLVVPVLTSTCPRTCHWHTVGAIPIAPGEVQRQHTREAHSCTQAIVVGLRDLASSVVGEAALPARVRVLRR